MNEGICLIVSTIQILQTENRKNKGDRKSWAVFICLQLCITRKSDPKWEKTKATLSQKKKSYQ